jgi:hypothetical protein
MPGISTAAHPVAVRISPVARPVRSPMRPWSRARPARGWIKAELAASSETIAPVASFAWSG